MSDDYSLHGMVLFFKGLDFSFCYTKSTYFSRTIHANEEQTALVEVLYKLVLMLFFHWLLLVLHLYKNCKGEHKDMILNVTEFMTYLRKVNPRTNI